MKMSSQNSFKVFWLNFIFCLYGFNSSAADVPKRIHVIVALCDNDHQGILPVNRKIGNGDDLANNLYWGCSDGLGRYFRASRDWTLVDSKKEDLAGPGKEPIVLETLTFKHDATGAVLTAEAWRGREIKKSIQKFADMLNEESIDLVAYIGHNGLMEFDINQTVPEVPRTTKKDAIVLCCKSQPYFSDILTKVGTRPVLLTDQFMYPGSFLLKAALDGWLKGESTTQIRERAAKVYAANQKISVSAARGVFSNLSEKTH